MGPDLPTALWRGFLAAGLRLPRTGTVLASIADRDKKEALPDFADLAIRGFRLLATEGTARFLEKHGISAHKCSRSGRVPRTSSPIFAEARRTLW
jgi:carbamoyl-phosphate synthase large subunit